MASLNGTQIDNTYPSLLKTTDNVALGANLTAITDGEGNATPLSMGTNTIQIQADTIELIEPTGGTNLIQISPTETYFEGTVNFANATVNGLPSAAGLVSGGQTDSMVSSSSLTTNAATTLQPGGIALGENAQAGGQGSVVIGRNATSPNQGWSSRLVVIGDGASVTQEQATVVGGLATAGAFAVALGTSASATGYWSTALGYQSSASGGHSVAVGRDAKVEGATRGIAIGQASRSRAENCITIGYNSLVDDAIRVDTTCIGANTKAAQYSTALGAYAYAVGDYAISIGDANTYATGAIAIGDQAQSFNNGAVALGRNITAVAWNDSTTVNQLAFANVANLNFADQAAAVTGGVPTGGLYHTDGTVKIVY